MSRQRYLVTCAPPNTNGDLHLGHLAGPFLAADVCRRYLTQRGHDVLYVSYTDDHSPYVLRKAEDLALPPTEVAFQYSGRMEATLHLAGTIQDYFEHPLREPIHDRTVQEFFRRLRERGAVETVETPAFWCGACGRYLYEAHVVGRCQFCGAASGAMYCEECGRPQDPGGLLDASCIRCRRAPEVRTIRRFSVPLSRYAAPFAERMDIPRMRPRLRAFVEELLRAGLPDTPISRVSDYGIPVPLEGWQGSILDTWFSGIFGYMAATAAYSAAVGQPDLWRELWAPGGSRLVQFIGFDCNFSHAVLWPCFLLALGDTVLPSLVISNEFYLLEGEKFSTSRGYAIWGSEFLRQHPADAVRFHLCSTAPETEQTSFWRREFASTVDDVLAGRLERWVHGLFELVRDDFDSTVPEASGGGGGVGELIATVPAGIGHALDPECFSPRQAARVLSEAIEAGERSMRETRTGRGKPGCAGAIADQVELLAVVAACAAPLMPAWSERVTQELGLPAERGLRRKPCWPEEGRRLTRPGQRLAAAPSRAFVRT
jgi:methionyl-tRNA synthetase